MPSSLQNLLRQVVAACLPVRGPSAGDALAPHAIDVPQDRLRQVRTRSIGQHGRVTDGLHAPWPVLFAKRWTGQTSSRKDWNSHHGQHQAASPDYSQDGAGDPNPKHDRANPRLLRILDASARQ